MLWYTSLVLGLATSVLGGPVSKRATCNGSSALCDKSYGAVSFLGSHDSYAISTNPLALGRNQEVSLTAQLDLGVRMLQAQGHLNNNQLKFCHTSCALFDGGLVVDYLKTVKTWLDAHPDEVVTLLVTNGDNVSLNDYWKPAFEQSGISNLAYAPPSTPVKRGDWPTLGSMISGGKRVVVFMDYNANVNVINYVLPEFPMVWEPPYDSTDDSFPCKVDRSDGPLSTADHLYMINHFLDVDVFGISLPDRASAGNTNSVSSIIADANGCKAVARSGANPNFVILDWVNVGAGVDAVRQLNGL